MGVLAEKRIYDNTELLNAFEMFYARQNSEQTSKTYEKHIRLFFEDVLGKDIQQITRSDIESIGFAQFEKFIIDNKNNLNGKTINQRVSAVKSLLSYIREFNFSEGKLNIDTGYFNVIKRVPEDDDGYGVLSIDEVFKMKDLALQERNERERKIKSLLLLLAVDTCLRKGALLRLKWSDFTVQDNGYVHLTINDKGNKEARKSITKELYEMLLEIKEPNVNRVFNIHSNTVDLMMKRFRKKMNIDPKRNITFHSIRKAGVTFQYRLHNDIVAAREAAGHSDVNTTLKYIEARDYGTVGAASINKDVQDFNFNDLTKEELIKIIDESKLDIQLILKQKGLEVIKNRENDNK